MSTKKAHPEIRRQIERVPAELVAQVRQALAVDPGDGARWPVLNRAQQRPHPQTAGLSVPRQRVNPIAPCA